MQYFTVMFLFFANLYYSVEADAKPQIENMEKAKITSTCVGGPESSSKVWQKRIDICFPDDPDQKQNIHRKCGFVPHDQFNQTDAEMKMGAFVMNPYVRDENTDKDCNKKKK